MEKEFLRIVNEHQNIIHKITRMYRDSKEDQEDLFQEIVFQLWKSFPNFRNDAKISTWMYRISLNTSIAIFRKNTLNLVYEESIPDKLHPFTTNETPEKEEQMYWALRQLKDGEKAIISLYLEDYSYQEIAEIIGISENYVGVQINRIKKKLKIILK